MASRGVMKPGSSTVTSAFSGVFRERGDARERMLAACRSGA
jgi:GTP cyclohydrolase I